MLSSRVIRRGMLLAGVLAALAIFGVGGASAFEGEPSPFPEAPATETPASESAGDEVTPLDTCAGGFLCVWLGEGFTGFEANSSCAYPGYEGGIYGEYKSAKNNCGYSERIGWQEGGGVNWKACLNPGGERPSPGRFNYFQTIAGSC